MCAIKWIDQQILIFLKTIHFIKTSYKKKPWIFIFLYLSFSRFRVDKKAQYIFKSFDVLNNLVIIDKHRDHIGSTRSNERSSHCIEDYILFYPFIQVYSLIRIFLQTKTKFETSTKDKCWYSNTFSNILWQTTWCSW